MWIYFFMTWIFSHQVGIENWCIAYSIEHRVCMYKSEVICKNVLASISDFESHFMPAPNEKIPSNFQKTCIPKPVGNSNYKLDL